MTDPVQIAFLVAVVAAFATFLVTLLAVAIYANLAPKPLPQPAPRKVIAANQFSAAAPMRRA